MTNPSALENPAPVDQNRSARSKILAHDNNVVVYAADSSVDYPVPDTGTVFVMLPAYNESEGLPSLLEKIQMVFKDNGRPYHVIVVDDASTDNTAEIASKASFDLPLTLCQHKVNQNLPGALRTGLAAAVEMENQATSSSRWTVTTPILRATSIHCYKRSPRATTWSRPRATSQDPAWSASQNFACYALTVPNYCSRY